MTDSTSTMICSQCGQAISFPTSKSGQTAKCPKCGELLRLVDREAPVAAILPPDTVGSTTNAGSSATANSLIGLLGCLGLVLLSCGGCAFLGWLASPSEEELAQKAASKAANEKYIQEQAEIRAKEAEHKEALDQAKLIASNQKNSNTFKAVLKTADVKFVTNISVSNDVATLTVSNAWHFMPYQIRFQTTQSLWRSWAQIASPDNVDGARIKIVDANGNEVGGSRAFAGSLIWVQDK